MTTRHFLSASPWLPLLAGAVVFLATWLTAWPAFPGAPGLTWDETYYYPTFQDVSQWGALALRDPAAALSEEGIRAGWQQIDELPPVVKWIGAFFVSLPGEERGWIPLIILRLYPALALGVTTALLILIGRRLLSGWWPLLVPAVYLLHPRIWGHGQVAATESVFALITVATLWVALHDLNRWKWRILLVLLCGVALATKVNGLILMAALVGWLLFRPLFQRRRTRFGPGWKADILLALALVLFPPFLALLIWPWMWHDTVGRITAYFVFIRDHAHQGLWYFGRRWNFNAPLVPPSYPFVITHLVTPVALLLAFWVALLAGMARFLAQRRMHPGRLLVVLFVLGPFCASSLPGAPKYDGIRLFLPLFAPAAVLLCLGLRDATLWWRFALGRPRRWSRVLAGPGLLLLLLLLWDATFRPKLDYYNGVARWMARSETIFPFEQTYWLNALDARALEDLNELLPPGARIKTRAFHGETLPLLQRWGLLDGSFDVSGDSPPFDAHLIQNRRGFWGNADWTIWQERAPITSWGKGPTGEGLILLYDGRPPGAGS